jgi:hypothetical protein
VTPWRTALIALQKALRYSLVPVLLLLGDGKAGAQSRGVRFEITQVGDSTFRFPRGTANWVKPGETGIAVDPRRHDVLVARFRIARIDSGLVTAVVTGQTTRVATEHIAVMTEPQKPWYRTITFWGGTVFGIVVGALIAGR